jgi:tRNA (guanine37-N1)-methyltransferase
VLLSGDHGAIERWRREQSERLTQERRGEASAR